MQTIAPKINILCALRCSTIDLSESAEAKDFGIVVAYRGIIERSEDGKDYDARVLCPDIWYDLENSNRRGGHDENTDDDRSCVVIQECSDNGHGNDSTDCGLVEPLRGHLRGKATSNKWFTFSPSSSPRR